MYRRQNILLLVMLGGMWAGTLWMYFYRQHDQRFDKGLFMVDDLTAVDQVVLNSKQGVIEITRDRSQWKVNGIPANPDMVEVLMATLARAEPRRPVSKLIRDSTARALTENGVHVTLSSGTQAVLTFYAGGNQQKTQAYFLKQGETSPYIMLIPGYRVYVSGVFEADETDWLDKRIFNFNWRNFKSLTADLPVSDDGFEVTFDGKFFSLQGIRTDTAKLNAFLDQVSLLEADQLILNEPLRDSLSRVQPAISFLVATHSNEIYRLSLYSRPGSGTVYGVTGSRPVALFDQRKVSELLKPRRWFELK
jgi:hypothetical protein